MWPLFCYNDTFYSFAVLLLKNYKAMIILNIEKNTTQELRIIPRGSDVVHATFINQSTKEEIEVALNFADAGYYFTADIDVFILGLEEEQSYRLIVKSKEKDIIQYKDTVFITNQDVIDNEGIYDINEGRYTSNESSSDYTIYND